VVDREAGRRLEVEVAGPSDGLVLVAHTGTPSGGRLYEPRVRAGTERGIRHVVYSRPGYGGSDRYEGRAVADCAEWLAHSVNAGLAPGIWGWFDDDLAFLKDWGFELGSIERPVTIWQGGQDRFVPAAHGEWLAAHVPSARAKLLPEHGHLSLSLGAYGEILDDLLAAAGRG
jgi:pimeloyl-ACP methyl ester carboxylesterase